MIDHLILFELIIKLSWNWSKTCSLRAISKCKFSIKQTAFTVGFNMLSRFRNSQKRVLSLLNSVNLKVFAKTLKLTQKKKKTFKLWLMMLPGEGNTSRNGNNLMMEIPLDHQCVPKIGDIWYLRKPYQLLLISIAHFLDLIIFLNSI